MISSYEDAIKSADIALAKLKARYEALTRELNELEQKIGAINSGDTFDYAEAEEHIKSVYEDLQNFIGYHTNVNGLTVKQCEAVYAIAHIDRNFDAELDRELINAVVEYFKKLNRDDNPPDNEPTAEVDDNRDVFSLLPNLDELNDIEDEPLHEVDPDEYRVTFEAFNVAAGAEIKAARQVLRAEWEAEVLYEYRNNPEFAARIDEARQSVKYDNGDWYFKGKKDADFKYAPNAAKARLSILHVDDHDFIIISKAYPEPPTPKVNVDEEDDFELYPIDFAIYHGGDTLSDKELDEYAAQLRKAITANGNFGEVEVEESYLSVIGDTGGDNKTIWKIVGDLCWRGECCLESYDAEDPHELREMSGEEIDALVKRMGINETDDAKIVNKIRDDNPPEIDDFTAKVAAFKADILDKQVAVDAAQKELDDATTAYNNFLEETVASLRPDWYAAQEAIVGKIQLAGQYGARNTIGSHSDVYIDAVSEQFAFVLYTNKSVARYDTPAQVKSVIAMFKAAVKRGDTEFKFPTVEELNNPSELNFDLRRFDESSNDPLADINVDEYHVTQDAFNAAIDAEETLAIPPEKTDFDRAIERSREDGWAILEINGETLIFDDGKLIEIGSPRCEGEIRFNSKSKSYSYRGARKSKADFAECINNTMRTEEQTEIVDEFMTAHGVSKFNSGMNYPDGKYHLHICPKMPNGLSLHYEAGTDDFNAARKIVDEFKACGVVFTARITDRNICGEVFYKIDSDGNETVDVPPEVEIARDAVREQHYDLVAQRDDIDNERYCVKQATRKIADEQRWLRVAAEKSADKEFYEDAIKSADIALAKLKARYEALTRELDELEQKIAELLTVWRKRGRQGDRQWLNKNPQKL